MKTIPRDTAEFATVPSLVRALGSKMTVDVVPILDLPDKEAGDDRATPVKTGRRAIVQASPPVLIYRG